MIGSIENLHPIFRIKIDQILTALKKNGWHPIIASGMRTYDEQDALYAQGRESLAAVNALRLRAKLRPLSAAENKHKVTNARGGQSNHNLTQWMVPEGRTAVSMAYGYAVDIVDKRYGWDKAPKAFWTDLGSYAKKYGCAWGGDWTDPYDPAHVEMKLIDGAPQETVVA